MGNHQAHGEGGGLTPAAADTDTIAAVATPPGVGGIGVVRVSGPAVATIATALLGELPRARHATLASVRDPGGSMIDQGIALYFPAPHSFTGEDVLELQGHGGVVVLDLLLRAACAAGARPARAGEFSQRAFLNGKLDLAQAEAIADLIEASSAAGARAALQSLRGELSGRVAALDRAVIDLRVWVEATLDFPDEETELLSGGDVEHRVQALLDALEAVEAAASQGSLLREGMTVVIAGRPNAGKSSLLNALTGRDTAIVTEVAGTTRDVLRDSLNLDGMPLHVIDTAGLRDSPDPVEREGVRRAWLEIERADRLLLVEDDSGHRDMSPVGDILRRMPPGLPRTHVLNKCDLSGRPFGPVPDRDEPSFAISALTGGGLDELRRHLEDCVGFQPAGEGRFMARRRHLEALRRARGEVEHARAQLAGGGLELLAEDLRAAHRHLGEITGEFSSEDLLGEIFTSFCIGK